MMLAHPHTKKLTDQPIAKLTHHPTAVDSLFPVSSLPETTPWSSRGVFHHNSGGYVTKFAPHTPSRWVRDARWLLMKGSNSTLWIHLPRYDTRPVLLTWLSCAQWPRRGTTIRSTLEGSRSSRCQTSRYPKATPESKVGSHPKVTPRQNPRVFNRSSSLISHAAHPNHTCPFPSQGLDLITTPTTNGVQVSEIFRIGGGLKTLGFWEILNYISKRALGKLNRREYLWSILCRSIYKTNLSQMLFHND